MQNIVVKTDGTIQMIYSDDLRPLMAEGRTTITRASHVEPTLDAPYATDLSEWVTDLSPVNGPRLGPFARRADALAAEVEYLNEHVL